MSARLNIVLRESQTNQSIQKPPTNHHLTKITMTNMSTEQWISTISNYYIPCGCVLEQTEVMTVVHLVAPLPVSKIRNVVHHLC